MIKVSVLYPDQDGSKFGDAALIRTALTKGPCPG